MRDFLKDLVLKNMLEYKLFNHMCSIIVLVMSTVGLTCCYFANVNKIELGFLAFVGFFVLIYQIIFDILSFNNIFKFNKNEIS